LCGYLTQSPFLNDWPDLTIYATATVSVFFVVPGLVISFVAEEKEANELDYATARLSRLYSVLVPALIFSGLVLVLAVRGDQQFMRPHGRVRSRASVFFRAHPIERFLFSVDSQ
jgi:hypothetical protein